MRKILSILLTISIIFSCINFSVFAETEGALSISAPTSASPGETINVILNIPSNTNALTGSFNLIYDNTALSVVTCTSGTILNDRNVAINKTYAENKIRMSFDGDTPLTQGSILLNVSFNVLSGASGTVSFDVEKFKLLDENYETIDIAETATTQMYIVNDAETKISVNCNDTVNTGGEITVTVDISNSLNICGGGFNLVYDADKFSISSVAAGSILSSFTKQLNKTYASNKVRLTWAGYSNMTQDGTMLTVVFKAKDGVDGEAIFSIEKFSFGDLNGATYDGATTLSTTNVVCTHNVMEWFVTEEPTCTETGTEIYSCGCGHSTNTREVSATGHNEMEWVITKEATCDDEGLKEYTCKSCGYVEKTEEIVAHGHIYESVVTAPTQAEGGFTTHTCTGCGHSYTDTPTAATGYTISYNVNGGTGTLTSQTKYYDETITLSLDAPTKEGYMFLGWTRTENGTVAEFAPGSSYSDNADMNLYAVWSANEHTITYVVDGETYSVQSYDFGTVIEAISEPEKEGYTFSGWDEIPVTMPDNDVTITGSFTINTYSVIFDMNNNDSIFDEQVVEYGSLATVPSDAPVLEGYSFVGWTLSKTSKKAEYESGDTFEVKENITLYAVWNVIWDGNEGESFAGGKGTITSPYRIENAAHLSYMAKMINSGEEGYASSYYIVTNNISLNDISNVDSWATEAPENEWTPIGNEAYPFAGTFDGNGYEIKGIYINKTGETDADSNQGLFGYVDGATISNFTIGDSYVKGYSSTGAFMGNGNNVNIKNCINKGNVSGNNSIGGIIGLGNASTINDCYNYGYVDGEHYIAGISGKSISSNFRQCYNFGTISGFEETGNRIAGISGHSEETTVIGCGNLGTIIGCESDLGGITGYMVSNSTVECCYNNGIVKGHKSIGGIVGAMNDTTGMVKSCINYGSVSQLGSETNTGGICGYLNSGSSVSKSINVGTITDSGSYKGAIVGRSSGTVEDCIYLSTCGASGSGKALSYIDLQRPVNYTGFYVSNGYVGSDYYFIGTNPYKAFPEIHNMKYPAARPITLNTNGGYLPEYIYAAKTYASELNGSRGAHGLVIYDDTNETTGTNIYGYEVIVNSRNEVIDFSGYGENNSTIPTGGFVLSGHAFMNYWLQDNVELGDKIYYDSSTLEIRIYKKSWNYTYFPGNTTYLPTPYKEGYVFSGWQDESGRIITYSTVINDITSLKLTATWTKPEVAAETTYGNSKYMRFDVGTCYESAKRYCESIGGHLATITSAEENAAITGITFVGNMSGYIIGASDTVVEGTFVWDTGETFSYTNWNSGEPNDSLSLEDTIEIKSVWNDISDSNLYNRGFVCEIDNYKPVGATVHNGHYYQIFNNNVSWDYAKAYCESQGGHLATITSEEENNAIIDALEECYSSGVYYWLGASDVSSEGNWEWVTDEEFSYTNWNPEQPDNAHGTEHYLHVYTDDQFGKWNDLPNTYSCDIGFICEFDSISPIATTEYNGHRYAIYTNPLSWDGAKTACEMIGGHLVTLNSQEEYDFVLSFYRENLDTNTYSCFYVGGNNVDGEWQWITGEPWEADAFWGDGEPDNNYGNENWLEYWEYVGGFNDIRPIFYSGTPFICEFEPTKEDDIKSGMYENISWSLENGILYLSGEGIISIASSYPWDAYADEISSIIIADGITDVGYAFSNLTLTIENIVIPKSITSFSENFGYGRITNATYAGSKYDFDRLIPVDSTDFLDTTMTYCEYAVIYDGLTVKNISVGETEKIIDDIPNKEGYEFLGWTTTQTSSTVKYEVGDDITPEKDITLYAVWKRNKFNITYVTAKSDEFGEWGEWQDASITNSATVNVEKRYRSRSKTMTTSTTTKTLDGWTYLRTTSQYSSWQSNGSTPVAATDTVSKSREVRTVYVPPVYKTQYHYFAYYNTTSPSMTYPIKTGTYTNLAEIWIDAELPLMGTHSTYGNYYGGGSYYKLYGYPIYKWYKVTGGVYGLPSSAQPYFQRQIVEEEGYTEYLYRDIDHTHHFIKYGEWSEWQSEPIVSSSVDIDIQYRQRSIPKEFSFVEENTRMGTITEKRPADDNYYCVGWSTEADSTETEYLAGETIELNNDIVLYAVWKEGNEGSITDSISWQVDENKLIISGNGTIPDYNQGTTPWYDYKDKITRIVIGSNITSIGDYAFYGLDKVSSIDLGGVTAIGDYAFSNCSSLCSIDTSKVTEFGSYSFRYCGALTEIVIVSDEVKYGNNVFSNCTGINSVTVNDGTTKIPSGILNNCGIIASISIPDSVVSIEENAFVDTSFTSVTFEGTKDAFAELLTTENLLFDKVTCIAESKTYLYTDFFAETINITSISFEKKSLGLYVGESATIVAQITPSNATEGYYWESDNELVAKVDGAGCVTALSEGIATITAVSENGDLKASCVVYVSAAINEDEPTIYCDSIEETKNGKSFDVNISLRNNPGIASMRLSLTYDASVMTLVNVSDLGLLGESVHSSDYTAESYTLYWDNGTATSNFTTDGAIVTLTFTIKSDAKSGDYPIIVDYDFNNDDIVNCELIPVKFEIVNGFVTVKSFVYGDVNDDGKVNPLDSAYLSRYLAKWPGVTINLDAADTNGDGKVNPLDSAILKRHIAKWPEYASLPYQN